MEIKEQIKLALHHRCFFGGRDNLARKFGCADVKVGFEIGKNVKKIIDYLAYDRVYNILYSFTIITDINEIISSAFICNNNYLVITEDIWFKHREELQNKLNCFEGIGLFIYENDKLICLRNCRHKELSDTDRQILKDSLISALFYKVHHYLQE